MSTDSPTQTYELPPRTHNRVTFEYGDDIRSGVVIQQIPDPQINDLDRTILRVRCDDGIIRRTLRDDAL